MSFKQDCVEAFIERLEEQKLDSYSIEIAKQSFMSGFEFGSLNGASDDIKKGVVNQLKPIKDKKAKEIIEKLRLFR
ncbi:hypothetical protein [Paenibacillus naphthalenovorans]|uniref:Uncharacterized protein n=1 Tax=Paenibacillus naphthalenovorans TaxID=162209 RepID=A0A0U2W413_9BACL|nr:hypothetical protein [Paenibacillus naphthalenovorans]ALS22157.1 hypothetical protein IJ22_17830 [Paenibacillus naphthalenovorans]